MARNPILPVLLVLVLAVPAAADETCYTTSTTNDETIVVEIPAPGPWGGSSIYIANDVCQDDAAEPGNPYGGPCLFSLWYYEEVNGIPGLQRDDEVHSDVRNCEDGTSGDLIIS